MNPTKSVAPSKMPVPRRRNRLNPIFLIMAGLTMVVLVVRHTYAAYLLETDPGLLVKLRPAHADGLMKLAIDRLDHLARDDELPYRLEGLARLPRPEADPPTSSENAPASDAVATPQQRSAEDAEEIRTLRERSMTALRSQPLNPQAMFVLGVLAAREGDIDGVNRFMSAVVAQTRRNRVALYSVLHRAFETREYDRALLFADALARLDQSNMALVAPIVWRMVETEAAMPFVVAALENAPPWRAALFRSVRGNIADARSPLSLFLRLKASGKAPDLAELSSYMELLIEHKLYSVARNTWLQGLDTERLRVAGFLFDGAFAFEPSRLPFEWQVSSDWRLIVQRAPREDATGNLMLRIDFSGIRTKPTVLSQMIMLMPGDYTLTGQLAGQVRARRGLSWVVECAEDGKRIAEGSTLSGSTKGWMGFELPVRVPPQGCVAQRLLFLIVAKSPSETMLTGSIMLDDLAIKRQSSAR